MKQPRFLLIVLGLALLGTLLLGGAAFEGEPAPVVDLPQGQGAWSALAQMVLGNAS